jgi:hypothetical protein
MTNLLKVLIRKIFIFAIGTIVHYLLAVLLLLALQNIFEDKIANEWLTAIPITILAQVLLVANYINYRLDKVKSAKPKEQAEEI